MSIDNGPTFAQDYSPMEVSATAPPKATWKSWKYVALSKYVRSGSDEQFQKEVRKDDDHFQTEDEVQRCPLPGGAEGLGHLEKDRRGE